MKLVKTANEFAKLKKGSIFYQVCIDDYGEAHDTTELRILHSINLDNRTYRATPIEIFNRMEHVICWNQNLKNIVNGKYEGELYPTTFNIKEGINPKTEDFTIFEKEYDHWNVFLVLDNDEIFKLANVIGYAYANQMTSLVPNCQ